MTSLLLLLGVGKEILPVLADDESDARLVTSSAGYDDNDVIISVFLFGSLYLHIHLQYRLFYMQHRDNYMLLFA